MRRSLALNLWTNLPVNEKRPYYVKIIHGSSGRKARRQWRGTSVAKTQVMDLECPPVKSTTFFGPGETCLASPDRSVTPTLWPLMIMLSVSRAKFSNHKITRLTTPKGQSAGLLVFRISFYYSHREWGSVHSHNCIYSEDRQSVLGPNSINGHVLIAIIIARRQPRFRFPLDNTFP